MVDYVIAPPSVPVLHVAGESSKFPVRRIYCVGRNYVAHAQEMGFTGREDPFFFCKPGDSLLAVEEGKTGEMIYPPESKHVDHEIELVLALAQGGSDIPVDQALDHVWGYAIGLDMTRRDLQSQAKAVGRPWELGKTFEHAATVGPLHRRQAVGDLLQGAIWLDVDGKRRQTGDLSQRLWSPAETIAFLSRYFRLEAGDLIFTGTPEGVGKVEIGDLLHGHVDGLGELEVRVVSAAVAG